MKRRKIFVILLIMCILMSVFITKSFAADTFSASITPSSTKVTKGEEFTISVKLSKIGFKDGISTFEAVVKFDSDVVTLLGVDSTSGWSGSYSEQNNKILFDTATAVKKDTEIGNLRFKMNDSTSATTAAIRLVSIKGGNAVLDEPISITDITTNISVGGGIPTTSPTSAPTGNENTNTNATMWPTTSPSTTAIIEPSRTPSQTPTISAPVIVDTPSPSLSPEPNVVKNTTTNDNIPKTGIANGYVIPLMALIAILGIISFVNYKKLNSK